MLAHERIRVNWVVFQIFARGDSDGLTLARSARPEGRVRWVRLAAPKVPS